MCALDLLRDSGQQPAVRSHNVGMRLFDEPKHVGCPNIGDREQLFARIGAALDGRWLTNQGPLVAEFEKKLERYLGVKHCIAVANATIGLQLVIRGLGLSGEVIVPSFTFPATAHALAWEGVRPVFCDVNPATHNIDPAEVERLITPQTSGIMGVHLWGNTCEVETLADIAKRHRLALMFDSAHAFACSHRGRMIGNFGQAEVFSFHATKFLNSAEGGAITTNDDDLASEFRRLRSFGLEEGHVVEIGTNAKMNELSAAMGLTSLESCNDFIARNCQNMAAYRDALRGARGLRLFETPSVERRNHQYVVVEVNAAEAGMSRDAIYAALHRENVLVKKYFHPGCHRMEPYRSLVETSQAKLVHTERLCESLLQFPNGTSIVRADIIRIGDFLRRLTGRARVAA